MWTFKFSLSQTWFDPLYVTAAPPLLWFGRSCDTTWLAVVSKHWERNEQGRTHNRQVSRNIEMIFSSVVEGQRAKADTDCYETVGLWIKLDFSRCSRLRTKRKIFSTPRTNPSRLRLNVALLQGLLWKYRHSLNYSDSPLTDCWNMSTRTGVWPRDPAGFVDSLVGRLSLFAETPAVMVERNLLLCCDVIMGYQTFWLLMTVIFTAEVVKT